MSRGDSRIPIALSCAWLLGCCAGPHSIAAAQALFSGLDLPPNATTAQAVAINDNGLVLMWTGFEGGRSWLRTPDGTFIDPAPPPGLTGSFLRGINDLDYAVGSAGGMAAVRAPDGAWTFLMPGTPSEAYAINNAGAVVGFDRYSIYSGPRRAFLYEPERGTEFIPTPAGASPYVWTEGEINIGGDGTVVTDSVVPGSGVRAFKYSRASGSSHLPTPQGELSMVTGANDDGVIVGLTGTSRATRWFPDGTLEQLPGPGGFTFANAINNRGDIVGSGLVAGPRALLWSDDFGATDLNELLTPQQRLHWELRIAYDINDLRQIVGMAMFDPDGWSGPEESAMRGFMLTLPHLPEPSLGGVILVGILLLCRRRCRR